MRHRSLYKFREDLLSVANSMVSDLLDPLPVVRHELPGLDRPIERASLCASITAIHTAWVSKECPFLLDRSCVSSRWAGLPEFLLYSYMAATRESVTERILYFWRNCRLDVENAAR